MINVTLFRAVTGAELDDIIATGNYRPREGSIEGKHFFESTAGAVTFARKMFDRLPNEGPYTFTSVTTSVFILRRCIKLTIAGEGEAVYAPETIPPLGPVKIWAYCPL
jgi:hypothetical protein